MKAIDLFSGAGGLSLGFQDAGFEIAAGIDSDESCIKTYKYNFPNVNCIQKDLNKVDDELITELKKADVFLGGPPCQGFSIAGKRISSDPRNKLIDSYLNLVRICSPSVIVIENVPNIMNIGNGHYASKIINSLQDMSFNVQVCILNAVNFGVPQNRKRIFFIATRESYPIKEILENRIQEEPLTTSNAISDLPFLEKSLGEEKSQYTLEPKTNYQHEMRKNSKDLYNHTSVNHTERTRKIISMVPDGGNYKDLPIKYQSTRKVNIAWTRMNSKKPCFTIDAGHNHHFHYTANRVPTVRECARIQAFPDNFIFLGNRTSQYRQVGNAVPPLMAKGIAKLILR